MKAEEKKMQRNVKNKILILTTHRTSPPLSFEPIPKVKTTNFLICRLKHSTRDFFFFYISSPWKEDKRRLGDSMEKTKMK